MSLKKKFLHPEIAILDLSRNKIIAGLLLGVFYAISTYSFFYVIREALRLASVTEKYDLWVLSEAEVSFYNLFFAFLSTIMGQAIFFSFLIDKPRKKYGKLSLKVTSIINDQRALIWYFLSWFSKLGFMFGIMFGATFYYGFSTFSFYPDFNYLFFLIAIVLFLNSWTTIRLTFKGNSFKWMLLSFLFIVAFSYSLSKFDVVDYNKYNESYLKNNIHHNFILKLPKSNSYERIQRKSLVVDIYVVYSKKDSLNPTPKILVNNNYEIKLDHLYQFTENSCNDRDETERYLITYRLYIHKEIKMKFINEFKHTLSLCGVSKIAYAVNSTNIKYSPFYLKDIIFPYRIHSALYQEMFGIKELYEDIKKFENIIEVKQLNTNQYAVNGFKTNENNLKKVISSEIQRNSDYILKFYINDSASFSSYFKVVSTLKEIIDTNRNKYSTEFFGVDNYKRLERENLRIVKKKFPFRIYEMTEKMVKELEPITKQ